MYFSRGPNKIQNPYNYVDMYEFYMKEIVKEPIYEVTLEQYKIILDKLFKTLINSVFDGETFIFPFGLGEYSIVKKKINPNIENSIPIDWKLSVQYKKKIYHLNEHSKGYKYRFYWNKQWGRVVNKKFYQLIATRFNKRELARLIKEEGRDYIEIRKSII